MTGAFDLRERATHGDVLRNIFKNPQKRQKDDSEQRRFVAWRLCREMLRISGVMASGDNLSDMPLESPDILENPPRSQWRTRTDPLELRVLRLIRENRLGLGPPPIGRPLAPWIKVIGILGGSLGIWNRRFGAEGLEPLMYGETAREAWPPMREILAVEERMLDDVFRILVDKSSAWASDHLIIDYGMTRGESNALVRASRRYALDRTESTVDDDRGMIVTRIEDIILRAKEAADLRTELMAVKALAIVQGAAEQERGSAMEDVISVIARRNAARELPWTRTEPYLLEQSGEPSKESSRTSPEDFMTRGRSPAP